MEINNIQRTRSFVQVQQSNTRQQQQQHQEIRRRSHHSSPSIANKGNNKPAIEIYRPPGQRYSQYDIPNSPGNRYLMSINETSSTMKQYSSYPMKNQQYSDRFRFNVHAKEFTASQQQQQQAGIQQSKSSGSIAQRQQYMLGNKTKSNHKPENQLKQSKSSGNILKNSPSPTRNVHFYFNNNNINDLPTKETPKMFKSHTSLHLHSSPSPPRDTPEQPVVKNAEITSLNNPPSCINNTSLQRSKSFGFPTPEDLYGNPESQQLDNLQQLGPFPIDTQQMLRSAIEDPNQLSARGLIELVRCIFNRLVEGTRYAEPAAKFCIMVIEKERQETFLETLLNTCQEWFHQREYLLRPAHTNNANPRWVAYMTFLNEMYCQLKRRQLQFQTEWDGVSPGLMLLSLICECCVVCVKPPLKTSLSEMECLFIAVSAVGRDLECEIPSRLSYLLKSVRDAFLHPESSTAFRKTLLQLVELHAAKWQLPASTLIYYYPSSSNNNNK